MASDDLKPSWRGTLHTTANVHFLLLLSALWHPKRDKILSVQLETVQMCPAASMKVWGCYRYLPGPRLVPCASPKESTLEVTNVDFKVRLDRLWAPWSSWCPHSLQQGSTRLHLRVLFNSSHSMVLWFCKSSQKALCFITCYGVGDGIFL